MKPEGHPPRLRVRKRSGFQNAYVSGNKRVGPHCVMFAVANGRDVSRLGVTATKKIGNAVHRNRAKRLVREAFRRVRPDLPTGYDFVVVARQTIFTTKAPELEPELIKLAHGAAR